MMNKLKNDSGITLMTLVITIIVLLILSTVAISSGKQAIENTKLTTFTAEMKIMQTHVNELYDKYTNGGTITIDDISYTGNDESNGIQNIGESTTNGDDYSKAKNYIEENSYGDISNYKIYKPELLQKMGIDGVKQTFLVNVTERKVVSAKGLKYEGRMYYTLEQLPEGLYNVEYTESTSVPDIQIKFEYIGEDKWRIMVSDIDYEGYISKWNVQYKLKDEANWHTSSETSFIVKKAGKYDIKVFNDKVESKVETLTVDHSEVKVSTIEKTGVFANDNIEEVREGNIPIPTGYTYVKGDKIGGAVITDAESGQEGEGSEFVWIPVSDINDMAQCDQADGTCNIQADTNDGHLYCSTHNNTNIVGKLYATSTGNNFGTVNTEYKANGGLREPAIVIGNGSETGTLYDGQYYSQAGYSDGSDAMLTGLQSEYKKMAASVAKYGGFYVGRYETSLSGATADDYGDSDSSTSVQSKAGVKSANASLSKTNMWYGLYNMSKTYAPGSDSNKSVVSSMIWGSQYDEMMRWMQGNGINVTEEPTNTPSPTLQNAVRNSSNTRVTGAEDSKDKLNNIYDILGNSYEWTLEAYWANTRVNRGGYYAYVYSPSNRNFAIPVDTLDNYGSRLTLYIK